MQGVNVAHHDWESSHPQGSAWPGGGRESQGHKPGPTQLSEVRNPGDRGQQEIMMNGGQWRVGSDETGGGAVSRVQFSPTSLSLPSPGAWPPRDGVGRGDISPQETQGEKGARGMRAQV